MLKVCIVFDCEGFISFKQGNPRWNKFERLKGGINNLVKNFRYNKNGFELIYETVKKEKFPATFMLVSSIFKKPQDCPKFVEIGYHTKNHLPLTLINDKSMKEEVRNIWRVTSITSPMWMVEDRKNPSRIFNEFKKQSYTRCIYRGENEGIKHFHYNDIKEPFKKYGITCIHVSNFFEGNWSKKRVETIKKDILKNLNKEGVYLLTTHDFSYKNNRNLLNIISFLKELERFKKIEICRIRDLK